MHQVVTAIDIAASPERVWLTLMDFSAYRWACSYPAWKQQQKRVLNAMPPALKNRTEANDHVDHAHDDTPKARC